MTRFDILSWHSDNEISKEKKKKRKSISRLQFCLKFFSLALTCSCNFPRVLHIYIYVSQRWHSSYLCTRVHLISRKQSWLSYNRYRAKVSDRFCSRQILITVAMTIMFYASCIFSSISISIGKTWRNNINFTKMITEKKKKVIAQTL